MHKFYEPERSQWKRMLQRPSQAMADIERIVEDIFMEVRTQGDRALKKFTERFDGASLGNFRVSQSEIKEASGALSPELKEAIQLAMRNITTFHKAQRGDRIEVQTMDGVVCWQEKRPIQKVGLYIPGGTAPLFSTILMLAVPAQIAGCPEIVLCTPPNREGDVDPAILYTAHLCGVSEIFKVGGIQAIAAMSFGTEQIPKVYKIFGPGNQYVTAAKQLATRHGIAIDMPAGPSELLVVADDTANAAFVASDLLSQAEHGTDSQVILVSTSKGFLARVEEEVERQMASLSRKAIAQAAMDNSRMVYVKEDATAMDLINEYAPEHFIICSANEDFYLKNVLNAGSIFVGNYTPESAGDYASGTNHTLPTNGFAKQYSGVGLDSFMKSMTFQRIDERGILGLGAAIETMAAAEGLEAHRNAVTLRLESLKD